MALSATVTAEKNKRNNAESVFLYAIEVTIPGSEEPARVVLNSENITWRGVEWVAGSFSIEGLDSKSTGEVPQCTVSVSNVNRVFEAYLQDWDTWCKNNGYTPIEVTLYELNTADLANNEPCSEHTFILKAPSTDAQAATFVLGAANTSNRKAPFNLIRKNYCTHKFQGLRCGYFGLATSCDKRLSTCRTLGNSKRFGGSPGAGKTGLTLVAGG